MDFMFSHAILVGCLAGASVAAFWLAWEVVTAPVVEDHDSGF